MRAWDPSDPYEAVGLAVTASVSSLKEHRGDHRIHIACMTKDRVLGRNIIIPKGVGPEARLSDGELTDRVALRLLLETVERPFPDDGLR